MSISPYFEYHPIHYGWLIKRKIYGTGGGGGGFGDYWGPPLSFVFRSLFWISVAYATLSFLATSCH